MGRRPRRGERDTRAQDVFQCRAEPACGNPGFLPQIGREWLLLLLLGGSSEKPSAFRRYRCKELDGGHLYQSILTHLLVMGLLCKYVLIHMFRYFTQSMKS